MLQLLSVGLPFLLAALLTVRASVTHAAVLDTPSPGSIQSGIGIITGWKCEAGQITAWFDGNGPLKVVHGAERGDTVSPCGDTNNGFIAPFNWSILEPGPHTIEIRDNGVSFASASFNVAKIGPEFVTGLSGGAIAFQFPSALDDTLLAWNEQIQNFTIVGFRPHLPIPSGGPQAGCEEHDLRANLDFGDVLQLDDGSLWEVHILDTIHAGLWLLFQDILLCKLSTDFGSERTMINLDRTSGNIIQVTPF